MTDYSGLVERLRAGRLVRQYDDGMSLREEDPVRLEAAAAIEAQRERIERLEGALREADEYLSANTLNSICADSILHQRIRAALEEKL